MDKKRLNQSIKKSVKGLINIIPIFIAILLLVSVITVLIPKSFYQELFTGNAFNDSLIGSLLGGVLIGNPLTSYVLGDAFLQNSVSLIAVTSFIVSWTTVGIIQIPAEAILLGRSFAIYRNIIAFVFSVIVAFTTSLILYLF